MTTKSIVTRPGTTPAAKSKTSPSDDVTYARSTTTVNKEKLSVLDDSHIPYMRPNSIEVVGMRLRPEKQVWTYFDNVDVTNFIQRPNILVVSGDVSRYINDIPTGNPDHIYIDANPAKVLLTEVGYTDSSDITTAFTRIYIQPFDSNITIGEGDTVKSSNSASGFDALNKTVVSYDHYSGLVDAENSTQNTIVLRSDANNTIDDYYVGNTLAIVKGVNAGQSREIIAYYSSNTTAVVNTAFNRSFTDVRANANTETVYSIGDYRVNYANNHDQTLFTSPTGYLVGTLHIPDPYDYSNTGVKFLTGKKILRVLDNSENDTSIYTTRAEYLFNADQVEMLQTQLVSAPDKVAPTILGPAVVATPPGVPSLLKTSKNNECKPKISMCNLRMDGDCFKKDTSGDLNLGAIFQGGYLEIDCVPRWRYVDINGLVIKGFPNRQYSDPSITTDAVNLKVPGADNYQAYVPNYTAGYHPSTRNAFSSNAAFLDVTVFPRETYMQYWAPETNGWGQTLDVSGIVPSDLFCKTTLCQPKTSLPTAQSFYVSAVQNKSGVFVASITLFFKTKGTLPIEVQVRPMINGVPSSDIIIPGSVAIKDASEVTTGTYPSDSTGTTFIFPSPIYLSSGQEYCFVILSDDWGYEYFTAEAGKTVLNGTQTVSKKQFSGSIYKAQTGGKWIGISDEDIAYVINKCNFATSTGYAILEEDKHHQASISNQNYYYDYLQLQSDAIEINSTQLTYAFKGRSNATNLVDGTYTMFKPDTTYNLSERKYLSAPGGETSFITRISMTTTNPDVSPIFFHNRQNLVLLTDKISTSGITSDNIVVTNPGSGYDESNTFVVISSDVYAANANAYAQIANGEISKIIVDYEGRGYFGNVQVTIVGGDNTATAHVNSETDPTGGLSSTRYISETVTLLDGFNAGDLRAYVTAIKPAGADVQVYYKVRNLADREPIDNRNWVRMDQYTNALLHSVNGEQHEYEFRSSLTSNSISYTTSTTTYKTFNQYAIKVVVFSNGTAASQIPYVYDVRAIAMPADIY